MILKSKDGIIINSDEKYWFVTRNDLIDMKLIKYVNNEYIFEDTVFWEIMKQINGPKIGDLVFIDGDIIKESNLQRMRLICWSKIRDVRIDSNGEKTYIFNTSDIYKNDMDYINMIGEKIKVKKDQIRYLRSHEIKEINFN